MKTQIQWFLICALFVCGISVAGCAGNQSTAPETTSSAASVPYAIEWADHLKTLNARYQDGSKQAREDSKAFSEYPDALNDPEWLTVHGAVKLADEAGRSQAVVEHLRSARNIEGFVEEHQKAIAWRIGGHVNASLKRQSSECNYETGRATMNVLEDAVDRQLEKAYREVNDAHRFLDEHAKILNKSNTKVLREQVDTITATSFFVNVDVIDTTNEIDRLLGELDDVRETLEKAIEVEHAAANDESASKGQQKAARDRLGELEAAKQPIDGAVEQAEALRENLEEDIQDLQDTYRRAFRKLTDDIEDRQ